MVSLKFLASTTLVAVAAASPFGLFKRQGDGGNGTSVTCGDNTYTSEDLEGATSEGCTLHHAGETVGNNDYPHTFNNREGLPLEGDGPYQEFPILTDGIYDGGSPGADRVVFTPGEDGECSYSGAITHTGAGGNNFVSCETE